MPYIARMSSIPRPSLDGLRTVLFPLLLSLLVACSDGSTGPDSGPVVDRVVVEPAQHALVVGDQKAYTVRVLDAAGDEIEGRAIAWSSTSPHVATVSNGGVVTALAVGATSIRAVVDGKSASGILDVSLAPVASVQVEPAVLTLVEGSQRLLGAVARDAAGRLLNERTATWTTTDASVATVSAAGTLTAHSSGTATIRATIEGVTAESFVTVALAVVDQVELSQTDLSIEEGEAGTIIAVARDAAGRVVDGRTITWESSDPAIVEVDAGGRLLGRQNGRAYVTASVQGRSATATVNVRLAAVAWIGITPTPVVLEIGETRQLQAILKDARGAVLHGRTVQWSVDGPAAAVNPAGIVTGKQNGYVTIFARSGGMTGAIAGTITEAGSYEFDLVYYRMTNTGQSELFTLPLGAGAAPVKLNAGNVSRSPSPSPDGSRIAFAVSMDVLGSGERIDDIFAVDRNGLNMRRLTTAAGADDQPAWSPAGGRIAYHHWEWETAGRSDIWIMNADGSGQENLTGDMPATGQRSSPAWTRDGSRIAFAQYDNTGSGTVASIWTMRADGSDKRQVTSTLSGFDALPTWNPDGIHIAFMRHYASDTDITVVNTITGALQRLILPGRQSDPAWSPDGSLIAFMQPDGPVNNLYTMQPNGSRVRLRTLDPAWGGGLGPAWINRQ